MNHSRWSQIFLQYATVLIFNLCSKLLKKNWINSFILPYYPDITEADEPHPHLLPFILLAFQLPYEKEREKREWSILIAFCWKLTRILKFAMRIISNQFFRYDSLKVSIWRMQIKHFYKFYLSLSKQNIPWRKQLTWCHTGIRKMHYHIQCTTRDS